MGFFEGISPVLLALTASVFMCLMTSAGASLILFTNKQGTDFTVWAGSFSAGVMLAASYFSLLAPAFDYPCPLSPSVTVTLGFCLGALFIAAVCAFSSRKADRSGILYLAVTMHNIPEGLALGVAFASAGAWPAAMLAFGIGVQNFPEGLCVACPLRAKGYSRKKSFLLSVLSGAVEIPAAVLGCIAVSFIEGLMPWALGFAAGAMVAVSASELIPESFSQSKTKSLFGLTIGFALMMFLDTLFG